MKGWRLRCLWCAKRWLWLLPAETRRPDHDCLSCPFCGRMAEVTM